MLVGWCWIQPGRAAAGALRQVRADGGGRRPCRSWPASLQAEAERRAARTGVTDRRTTAVTARSVRQGRRQGQTAWPDSWTRWPLSPEPPCTVSVDKPAAVYLPPTSDLSTLYRPTCMYAVHPVKFSHLTMSIAALRSVPRRDINSTVYIYRGAPYAVVTTLLV